MHEEEKIRYVPGTLQHRFVVAMDFWALLGRCQMFHTARHSKATIQLLLWPPGEIGHSSWNGRIKPFDLSIWTLWPLHHISQMGEEIPEYQSRKSAPGLLQLFLSRSFVAHRTLAINTSAHNKDAVK